MKRLLLLLICLGASAHAQIKPEPIGMVATLPDEWPAHWVVAADSTFFHMNDAKFIVIDADSDDPAARFKGMINGSQVPLMRMASSRPELYVIDTFYSRGNRGERTDVLTIYDKKTLSPVDEVVIPPKRMSAIPTDYYFQLIDDEKFALIYNFTPATSVSVVDLENHKFVGEVQIPGCALVYPMAGRAFASLCTNGAMMSVQLDETGAEISSTRSETFFDADNDPLTEKPAIINGVAYFPTFLGNVHPVDLNGALPVFGEPWSLTKGMDGGWRPGGIALAGADSDGLLYVMMHPAGYDGSHKDPATEVWVFDPEKKERIRRIELTLPAITMGLTLDDDPLLLTTNVNLEVDVYSAKSGEHLRSLGNFGQETVFAFHAAR